MEGESLYQIQVGWSGMKDNLVLRLDVESCFESSGQTNLRC